MSLIYKPSVIIFMTFMKEVRKKVLGVNIDDVSVDEALAKVTTWLKKSESKIIVTPGPEFLVTAQNDQEFKKILNAADLAIPDGFGLHLAGVKNRVPGVGFMLKLCELSAENGWSVGLLGGQTDVAHQTASNLIKRYPKIKIPIIVDGREADDILAGFGEFSRTYPVVDLLFVALGHPKQERLLARLRENNLKFRVGMGVGGAFDYISEAVPGSPGILRSLGLEWLWRLVTQHNRLLRIFKATVVFPLLLFRDKFLREGR